VRRDFIGGKEMNPHIKRGRKEKKLIITILYEIFNKIIWLK